MRPNSDSLTILIAEDDPDDRFLIEDALRENDVAGNVQFVADGVELLDYLKRQGKWRSLKGTPQPILLLLDLNMPRMDGREALRRIRADESLRTLPVVVLSTSKAEEDVLSSYSCGVNSFISKPGTFEGLVEVVRVIKEYWINWVRLPTVRVR